MTENKKMLIWILIPLIYGLVSNTFMLIIPPFLSQLVFAIFWFWVGMKLSCLSGNKVKIFFIGNSVWLLSFLIYLWQFVFLDDESRNMFLASISQYYMLPFIWSGTKLSLLFTDVIHGTTITIIAYCSMLCVFTVGFIVGKVK
ncbi:hypothetical protein NC661_04060 [Aquibacillus koreensis]|uniref:Uncharacterized protein n=1 Tax=Aquibacillus koreensis TaxID=279446 RepID=A0A9X3WLT6_9BACI|nr:hypothetical protein [Aquibacillus koreensis]MCT2534853.1 hypothetical protein [Aquibacillus koreensis]MDC3419536.1 hypothetical protein [Aquibacillus koreensis]